MSRLVSSLFVMLALWPAVARAQDGVPGAFIRVGPDSIWVNQHPAASGDRAAPSVLLVPGWPAMEADVLGLGEALGDRGFNVFVLHPRGHGRSSGSSSFAGAMEDIAAARAWIENQTGADSQDVIVGGYSWGGGVAAAYAATDPEVRRLLMIAASDHGVFIRRFDADSAYGEFYRRALLSTQAPQGPVRFDLEADLTELRTDWAKHDLATIAPRLATKDILIVVGWDDQQVELEHQVVPFYRAMRIAGAESMQVAGYQDDHSFRAVRQQLQERVHHWLVEVSAR